MRLFHGQNKEGDEYSCCAQDAANIKPVCYSSEAEEICADLSDLVRAFGAYESLRSGYTQSVCGHDRQQLIVP